MIGSDVGRIGDIQVHAIAEEHENVFDRLAWMLRYEPNLPAEIADLRIELVETWNRIDERHHFAGAERTQFVKQQERIGSGHQCVVGQPETHLPNRFVHRRWICLCRSGACDDGIAWRRVHDPAQIDEDRFAPGLGLLRAFNELVDMILCA